MRRYVPFLIAGLTLGLASPAGAISGSAGSVDASAAQYISPSVSAPLGQETPPTTQEQPSGEALPLGEEVPEAQGAPAATPTPVAELEEGQTLPFTGYALLAVLGAGLLSLLLGVGLRRFTARGHLA